MKTAILIWVLLWNLIALLMMGMDKWQARRNGRRIPERVLFLSAILGGSVGALVGMSLFRHKTRHRPFTVGMPCILILQILLLLAAGYRTLLV